MECVSDASATTNWLMPPAESSLLRFARPVALSAPSDTTFLDRSVHLALQLPTVFNVIAPHLPLVSDVHQVSTGMALPVPHATPIASCVQGLPGASLQKQAII